MSDDDLVHILGPLYQAAKDSKQLEGKKQNVFMDHVVTNENGTTRNFRLNMADESKGTENLFLLAPIILRALQSGETIIIDEIERSLHPLLVKHIIGYFNDPERNKMHAQLIFNTHNLETGSSELYSLDEFSVRAEENIKKGYLLGRFGAIPSIMEGRVL